MMNDNEQGVMAVLESIKRDLAAVKATQAANLENFTEDSTGMPERKYGMEKHLKERVEIGRDEHGKPVYQWVTGYNRQALLRNAALLLLEHGQLPVQVSSPKPEIPLFKAFALNWLKLYKTDCIRHTTCGEYSSLLRKHLIPAFGDTRVSDITPDMIQAFMNERKHYSKKSIHEMKMVLAMILDGAVEEGYISRNPAKSKRLKNPSKIKKPRKALTEEQVRDIIQHIPDLKQSRDQRYLALLIYTGMRREEV